MVIYRHELAPLRIESDAIAEQLADVRRRLASWLRAADVPDELAADIVLVVNEACTNSVEHAYRGHSAGTMLLEGEAVGGVSPHPNQRLGLLEETGCRTPATVGGACC